MYVNVDIDVLEILGDLTDEEVEDLYKERFPISSGPTVSELWKELYEARMRMTNEAFLKHIDVIIMDHTGRIICDR
jgi:hypothetical protein